MDDLGRCAYAIARADGVLRQEWDEMPEVERTHYRYLARAAIKAYNAEGGGRTAERLRILRSVVKTVADLSTDRVLRVMATTALKETDDAPDQQ